MKPSRNHTLILVLLICFLAPIAAESLDGKVGKNEAPDVPAFGYLLLGTLALHLLVLYVSKIRNSGYPNLKLLVLRVFGEKDQARMTFARLLTFWKHFGTYFTIVDPSYLNYRYRTFSIKTALLVYYGAVPLICFVAIFNLFVVAGAHSEGDSKPDIFLLVLVPTILGWSFIGVFWGLVIRRNFIGSVDAITRRLDGLKKNALRLDLTFRERVFFCHKNTWKHAVYGFIKNSDAVLMDLRGISIGENTGCEFEVDLLMDTFPLEKVVFLVSEDESVADIGRLLRARWELLRVSSPNWDCEHPVARIYTSQSQQGKDIVNLIKMTLSSIDARPSGQVS